MFYFSGSSTVCQSRSNFSATTAIFASRCTYKAAPRSLRYVYHVSYSHIVGQAILLLLAMPEPGAVLTSSVLGGFIEIAVRIGVVWLLRRSRPEPDAPVELWAKWNRTMLVTMNNTQGDMIVAYLASNMAIMMQVLSFC